MFVKKYAIYKIELVSTDSFSNLDVNKYSNNEINIRFNKVINSHEIFTLVSATSLIPANSGHSSMYFDTEYEAINAVELNRYNTLLNINYGTKISIIPVLEDISDSNVQEIRRLKLKGILQDDRQ
jgi:hypothetical protein